MISNLHLIATQSLYDQQRYNEIRLLEGTNQGRPYLDTTGNPSVGIGFNLRGNPIVRAEVFLRMGIDPTNQELSAAQQAAELGYLSQLNTAAAGSYASSEAVRTALDAIMAARAGNAIFQGITRITKRSDIYIAASLGYTDDRSTMRRYGHEKTRNCKCRRHAHSHPTGNRSVR